MHKISVPYTDGPRARSQKELARRLGLFLVGIEANFEPYLTSPGSGLWQLDSGNNWKLDLSYSGPKLLSRRFLDSASIEAFEKVLETLL